MLACTKARHCSFVLASTLCTDLGFSIANRMEEDLPGDEVKDDVVIRSWCGILLGDTADTQDLCVDGDVGRIVDDEGALGKSSIEHARLDRTTTWGRGLKVAAHFDNAVAVEAILLAARTSGFWSLIAGLCSLTARLGYFQWVKLMNLTDLEDEDQ